MYTGTLIADLFEAVKRAEKAAADPFSVPRARDPVRHGVEADSQRYAKEELQSE